MEEKQQMLCDLFKSATIDHSLEKAVNEGVRIGRLEMRAEILDAIVKHEGTKEELINVLKAII